MRNGNQRKLVTAIVCVGLVLPLASCETGGQNQTIGTIGGGVAGGVLGGVAGAAIGGRTGAVIGAVAGTLAGAFAGSTIGKRLDDADRQRAQAATQRALDAPMPAQQAQTAQAPRNTQARTQRAASTRGQPVAWRSDRNAGNRGSAQVINRETTADGRECRDVQEIAYVRGEEVRQTSRYCRDANGGWTQAA